MNIHIELKAPNTKYAKGVVVATLSVQDAEKKVITIKDSVGGVDIYLDDLRDAVQLLYRCINIIDDKKTKDGE